MANEKDIKEFDDQEAIAFIINSLDNEQKLRINEEIITYVLDLIDAYYVTNGYFDDKEEDIVEDAEIAEDDMFDWINAAIRKEKIFDISDYDLQTILDGEYGYGMSIGIYDPYEEY